MSEYYRNDTPDKPIGWTLESEQPVAKLNLSELWQTFRTRTLEAEAHAAKHGLYERGHGNIPVNRINTYFEMQEEPQL